MSLACTSCSAIVAISFSKGLATDCVKLYSLVLRSVPLSISAICLVSACSPKRVLTIGLDLLNSELNSAVSVSLLGSSAFILLRILSIATNLLADAVSCIVCALIWFSWFTSCALFLATNVPPRLSIAPNALPKSIIPAELCSMSLMTLLSINWVSGLAKSS